MFRFDCLPCVLRAALVTLVLVSGGVVGADKPASSSDAGFLIGVGTHVAQQKIRAEDVLRLATELGLNSVRDEIYWDNVEQIPGVFKMPERFVELDRLYGRAKAQGLSPLIILNYGNRNYEGGGFPTHQNSILAYARYVQWVVQRYRSTVNHFEIWNEWNNGIGLPRALRKPGSPESYVRLLAAAEAAVRTANPDAVVIAGAVAAFDEQWIRGFLAAGGMQHADGFSVHPYTFFERDDSTPLRAIAQLDRLDALMREYTGRSVPIYVTEIGWPTHAGRSGVSAARQADYLSEFLVGVRARPWIRGVWWYELKDSGDNSGDHEHRFGLVDLQLKSKVSVSRLREAIEKAAGN